MKASPAPPSGNTRLRPSWRWLLLGGLPAFGTWIVLVLRVPSSPPEDFPALPDLGQQNPTLRTLLVSADTAARRRPGSAEETGRLGMIYHANQFYEQAEKAYGIAARLDGDDHRWPYCRALVREETGRENEVRGLLQAVVQLRPEWVPALQKLGDICYKQDDLDRAARYYERSAAAAGRDTSLQALFGLGRIATRRKEWNGVVELVEPLARQYPRVRTLHQLLLDAYESLGQAEKAEAERRALLDPTLIVVPPVKDSLSEELLGLSCSSTRLLKEAGLLSRFRRPDDAIRVARRAAEVEPGDADAHHLLARTLLEAHGDDPAAVGEALAHLGEGLRLRPDDALPLWYFATVFFKQEKTDAAVEQLRSMVAAKGGRAEAHYYLGLIADRQGRGAEAVEHYQGALKRDPSNAEACHKLGLMRVTEGRLADAVAWFRKAVSLKPDFTMARCNLGVALDQLGNTAQAIAEFREALVWKPNDATTHRFLAIALLRTGGTAEAVSHFREAIRFAPDGAEAHYGLGCALMLQRKNDEAADELHEALRLRPDYADARDRLRLIGRPAP